MTQPHRDAGDGIEAVHTADKNTNGGSPDAAASEEAAFQWPTLTTEAEMREDAAKRSPWGVAVPMERKINYILEGVPDWTRNGKYGPPSYAQLPTDLLKAKSATNNRDGNVEQQAPFTAVGNASRNKSNETGWHGKQETGRKRRTAKGGGDGKKRGTTISSTPETPGTGECARQLSNWRNRDGVTWTCIVRLIKYWSMFINAISYSLFVPGQAEKSHNWLWTVAEQKQEMRKLAVTLEIEHLAMDDVLFRYPIGKDNGAVMYEASTGLGELSIGRLADETAVRKRTCHHSDNHHRAETEPTVFLTKQDYINTRGYRDCSDRQLVFWWHWYVGAEGKP